MNKIQTTDTNAGMQSSNVQEAQGKSAVLNQKKLGQKDAQAFKKAVKSEVSKVDAKELAAQASLQKSSTGKAKGLAEGKKELKLIDSKEVKTTSNKKTANENEILSLQGALVAQKPVDLSVLTKAEGGLQEGEAQGLKLKTSNALEPNSSKLEVGSTLAQTPIAGKIKVETLANKKTSKTDESKPSFVGSALTGIDPSKVNLENVENSSIDIKELTKMFGGNEKESQSVSAANLKAAYLNDDAKELSKPEVKSDSKSLTLNNLNSASLKTSETQIPRERIKVNDSDVRGPLIEAGFDLPGGTWELRQAKTNLSEEKLAYEALEKMKAKEGPNLMEGLSGMIESLKENVRAEVGIAGLKRDHSNVDSKDLSEQIESHLDFVVFRPGQQVKVTLEPQALGKVEMIARDKGGSMEVDMKVENSQALESLKSESKNLIEKVSDSTGIQISQINFQEGTVQQTNNTAQNSNEQFQQNLDQGASRNNSQNQQQQNQANQDQASEQRILNFAQSSLNKAKAKSGSDLDSASNLNTSKNSPSTLWGSRVSIRA